MYKLIAMDLDGTLTNDHKEILTKTKELLLSLSKRGIVIVLASGRPTPGLFKEAKELELDKTGGYLLSYNGARMINYKTNEVIYNKTITVSQAHEMYDRAKLFGLSAITYSDKEIITEDCGDHWIQLESRTSKMPIHQVSDFKATVTQPVNKVLATGEPSYVAQIIDDFKAPYEKTMSIYRSDPYYIECVSRGIDKASALKILCDKLHIQQEETIAFGDGYNDLSLIEWCHLGVAMDNAIAEVKQRANYITKSNNDNGISFCLNQLIENNEL